MKLPILTLALFAISATATPITQFLKATIIFTAVAKDDPPPDCLPCNPPALTLVS